MVSSTTQCGKITLPSAARFSLHTLRSFPVLSVLVKEAPELQEIVHTKCRPASGDAIEGILRHHVRHIGQQGLKLAARVVIEDAVLTPGEFPRHQFVLGATQWVKGMGYAEPARGSSHTTCIR
jgi:hypothetical protein